MKETPDVKGLLTKITGSRRHAFLEFEHNFFFSRTTVSNLLSEADFRAIRIEPTYKLFTLCYLLCQTAWYNKALSRLLVRLVESLGLPDKLIEFRQPGEMIVFAQKS